MKKHMSNILIVLFLSLMVVGCFQDSGIIKGKITDKDNKPMSKIKVMVKPGDYEATTDENGEYTIEEVPFGDYTVTATSGSYNNAEEISVKNESSMSCESIDINSKIEIEVNIKIDIGTPGYTLTTNVNPSGAGTINLDPAGGTYEEDTEVTLTAIASNGYIFSNWSGGASGTSNPTVVTVSTNITVTADFSVESSLVAYYKFDENSGDTISDSAGTNNGTRYGATWITGVSGSALDFDGVDDYVEIPHAGCFNITDKITLTSWVKIPESAIRDGHHYIIGKRGWGEDAGYALVMNKQLGGVSVDALMYIQDIYDTCNGNTLASFDEWHHIAATYDGEYIRVYLDGQPDGQLDLPGSIQPNTIPLQLGGSFAAGITAATIDEVYIYNRVLTDTEILQQYNSY